MKSFSLRTQILVLVLTLVSIALGSLIITIISQEKSQLRTSIEQKAISICTVVKESIGPGLVFQDSSYISDYAGVAFADEDVVGICIRNENEKTIYRDIRGDLSKDINIIYPAKDSLQISHFGNYCSVSTVVYSQGIPVGNIWLALSTKSVSDRIESNIRLILLMTSVVLLFIILASSYITRKIVRPIGIFEEASEKIRQGDTLSIIEISPLGKDFKSLGIAFNKMSVELESAFEKLHESKVHLEDQVHERTKDLQRELADRMMAEDALRESKQRIALHVEQTPLGVIEWDLNFEIVEWNNAAEKIFGYTRAEATGRHPADLIIPDSGGAKERIDKVWKTLLKGKDGHRNTNENITKDGKTILCEWYNTPLISKDGKVIGAASLVQDITEHKRAENALRESESKYRTLYDKAYDAIFLMQVDKFIDCNTKVLEMFDCTREQIIGQSPVGFSPEFQPDGRRSSEKALEKIQSALAGKKQIFEWVHCKYDRTPFPAEVNLNSMELDGETCILAFVRDITERKTAEEQENSLKEKLERAERMESLGILAGGIAHDLNNMLGPLVGYPELMLLKMPENSPLRKQITRIGNAAQRASDVVQDLLTLARRGRYEMEPTNVNEIIETYLDSPGYTKLVDTHPDTKILFDLKKPLANISGSSPHLSKVFMNLIVNAFDAMPEGGTLKVTTSQKYLEELLGGHDKIEPGDYIVIIVSDTGMGIEAKDLDKIFEPYYSKKKMGSSGSGLGLSVVYGVVKDHKGYYDVLSTVGKGTEFILYFPVSNVEIKRQPAGVYDKGGNERILVVDDAPDQREMAAEILSSFGYRVETAVNGSDAVKYLKDHSVDMVVLDMIMETNFDGLDTYREIIKIHPGQKAIIVSGFSATDRVQKMLELGAGQYVKKPYTMEMIGRAIREELDKELATR